MDRRNGGGMGKGSSGMSAEHTPLNLTLRDLIDECDELDVIDALIAKDPATTGDGEGYSRVIDELWHLPPTPPLYPILLSVYNESDHQKHEEYIDVGLWNPGYVPPPEGLAPEYGLRGTEPSIGHYNAEADIHQKHFGMGLTPWAELIDAAVYVSDVEAVGRLAPTLAHVLAEVLWEMTFYGYSDAAIKDIKDSIVADMDAYLLAKNPTFNPDQPDSGTL